jgi:MoxR-like ATPase
MTEPAAAHDAIHTELSKVLVGNEELIERLTAALLTRGHVLIEGVPGVAKTTAANLFARASGLEHHRIQMTPDILPADITGTHVYREQTGEFSLQRGPIFSNIVVADEINRATPKTQSALLEAMEEFRVTIEGETLDLPDPFMVIATQNPIEMEGTFELPAAQRDRFQFKLQADLPSADEEREILDRFDKDATLGPEAIDQVLTPETIRSLRRQVQEVTVAPPVKQYILDVIHAVRASDHVSVGVSPRASLTLLNAGKARAAIRGRSYVIPDDVKALAKPVLRHRIVLSTEADIGDRTPDDIISRELASVAPPSEQAASRVAHPE